MKKSRKPLRFNNFILLFLAVSLTLSFMSQGCGASSVKETKDGFYFDTIISITLYENASEKAVQGML